MQLTKEERAVLEAAGVGSTYWKKLGDVANGTKLLEWYSKNGSKVGRGLTLVGGEGKTWEPFYVLACQVALSVQRSGHLGGGPRVVMLGELARWLADMEDERAVMDGMWFIPDFHEAGRDFPLRQWESTLVIESLRRRIMANRHVFVRVDSEDMPWWPNNLRAMIAEKNGVLHG